MVCGSHYTSRERQTNPHNPQNRPTRSPRRRLGWCATELASFRVECHPVSEAPAGSALLGPPALHANLVSVVLRRIKYQGYLVVGAASYQACRLVAAPPRHPAAPRPAAPRPPPEVGSSRRGIPGPRLTPSQASTRGHCSAVRHEWRRISRGTTALRAETRKEAAAGSG